ncbi:MAG: RDD family protein [Campylobacterales bacterium]|nr:RDD family protein [Campylobacterales bacterium]
MNETIETLLHRYELHLASIPKRAVAFLIDELLLSLLFTIMLWGPISKAEDMETFLFVTNAYALEYLGMKVFYQTLFVALYGATLGKMAMRIRVVAVEDGGLPGWLPAFNRAIFRILSEIIFYLGFIWAMFDPNNQAWHDRTARTVVVDA